MKLITSLDELYENVETFRSYRDSIVEEERAFYRDLLPAGRNLVAMKVRGRWEFCPSRFAGYRHNTFAKHHASEDKDGRDTTPKIDELTHLKNESDAVLELEFQRVCDRIRRPAHQRERTFWRLERRSMRSPSQDLTFFTLDRQYNEWCVKHPDRFVLNTDHSFSQTNSVLHKASCDVLKRTAETTAANKVTQGDYYKIGAKSLAEARQWLRSKKPATSARLCGICFRNEIIDPGEDGNFGFHPGALYHRKDDIHSRFDGQAQGGISTPKRAPVVILFTGESGLGHGYDDEFDDKDGVFHYVGEGQTGPMRFQGGNLAIRDHLKNGSALLLFRALGKSQPYRYMGRFVLDSWYEKGDVLDTHGSPRTVIVFRLRSTSADPFYDTNASDGPYEPVDSTSTQATVEIRTKQRLFRDRLARIEDGCRVTGIRDLRFLRASHIKPWSQCTHDEKVDGKNGLLLAPHLDLLFDRGWISFLDNGQLLVSKDMPPGVLMALGIDLDRPRSFGAFHPDQRRYLAFHREKIFKKQKKD